MKLNNTEMYTLVLDGYRVGDIGLTKLPEIGEVLRTDFGKYVVDGFSLSFTDEIMVKKFVGESYLN